MYTCVFTPFKKKQGSSARHAQSDRHIFLHRGRYLLFSFLCWPQKSGSNAVAAVEIKEIYTMFTLAGVNFYQGVDKKLTLLLEKKLFMRPEFTSKALVRLSLRYYDYVRSKSSGLFHLTY